MKTNLIIVDGSYFICFRYHALRRWWGYARRPDEPKTAIEAPRFLQKFRDTFRSKLRGLPKLAGCPRDEPTLTFAALDCPSANVWRRDHWPAYKGTRIPDAALGQMFELTDREGLFTNNTALCLAHPRLEADDCIALTVRHVAAKASSHVDVTIISSDTDYLQLMSPRVRAIDLKGKPLSESKVASGDPERDLFCKVISGDKSDNIPSILPGLGPRTALKYHADKRSLWKKIAGTPEADAAYRRNTTLIDFSAIPENLTREFYLHYGMDATVAHVDE